NKWGRDLWSWAGWLAQGVAIALEESKIPQVLAQGQLKSEYLARTQVLCLDKIRAIRSRCPALFFRCSFLTTVIDKSPSASQFARVLL
ncbi:MAG: hypothetical protein ORN83_05705, partial [Chthoniobacteraceae bacterium]|nr:hypothetical protein [Chthoniobacteraceae bacterium]